MGCGASEEQKTTQESKPPVECPLPRDELQKKGYHHEVLEEGTGTEIKKGQPLVIDFKGYLADPPYSCFGEGTGKEVEAGKGLVKGMNKGILEMQEGETAIIACSPDFGYKDQPVPGVPPGSTLLFRIKVVQIGKLKKDHQHQATS